MNQCITGWRYFPNPRMFSEYGRQKGWERENPATDEISLFAGPINVEVADDTQTQNIPSGFIPARPTMPELKTKVSEGRKRLSDEVQFANDAKQWVKPFRMSTSQSWTQPPLNLLNQRNRRA